MVGKIGTGNILDVPAGPRVVRGLDTIQRRYGYPVVEPDNHQNGGIWASVTRVV